ncbi:MAG: hypothetical protein JXQ82_07875 [Methanomicrobiaceae archaeon]|nr:hypothetical protein [Methanomicrobiaceae archaeon]
MMFIDVISMAIKKEKKDFQTTVKMPQSLKNDAERSANELGISLMEYIRRAVQEKLDRESGAVRDIVTVTDEELDARIEAFLEKKLAEKKLGK